MTVSLKAIESARVPSPAKTTDSSQGVVALLARDGSMLRCWRSKQSRCVIGSSPEATLCIQDENLAGHHVLVLFGRRHVALKALEGNVVVAGRVAREHLFDKPTDVLLGTIALRIYPAGTEIDLQAEETPTSNWTIESSLSAVPPTASRMTFPAATPSKNVGVSPEVVGRIASNLFTPLRAALDELRSDFRKAQQTPTPSTNSVASEDLERIDQSITKQVQNAVSELRNEFQKTQSTPSSTTSADILQRIEQLIAAEVRNATDDLKIEVRRLQTSVAGPPADFQSQALESLEKSISDKVQSSVEELKVEFAKSTTPNELAVPTLASSDLFRLENSLTQQLDQCFNTIRSEVHQLRAEQKQLQQLAQETLPAKNGEPLERDPAVQESLELLAQQSRSIQQQRQVIDDILSGIRQQHELVAETREAFLSFQISVQQSQSNALSSAAEIAQRDALAQRLDLAEQNLKSREQGLESLRIERDDAIGQIQQLQSALQQSTSQAEDLHAQLNDANQNYSSVTQRLTQTESQLQEIQTFAQQNALQWQSSYEQLQKELERYRELAERGPAQVQEQLSVQVPAESQLPETNDSTFESFDEVAMVDSEEPTPFHASPASPTIRLSSIMDMTTRLDNDFTLDNDFKLDEGLKSASEFDTHSEVDEQSHGPMVDAEQESENAGSLAASIIAELNQERLSGAKASLSTPESTRFEPRIANDELVYGGLTGLEGASEDAISENEVPLLFPQQSEVDSPDDSQPIQDEVNAFAFPVENDDAQRSMTDMPKSANDSSDGKGEQEDSIEDYMQQLLQRVRAGAPGSGNNTSAITVRPEPKIQPAERKTPTASASSNTSNSIASEISEPATSVPEAEPQAAFEGFTPRQQAPELQHDMLAMRELANVTARKAIARSDDKRRNSEIFFKGTVAFIGLVGGMLLLLLNGFRLNMALVGSVAGFIVAGLWGYEAITQFNQAQGTPKKSNTPEPKPTKELTQKSNLVQ